MFTGQASSWVDKGVTRDDKYIDLWGLLQQVCDSSGTRVCSVGYSMVLMYMSMKGWKQSESQRLGMLGDCVVVHVCVSIVSSFLKVGLGLMRPSLSWGSCFRRNSSCCGFFRLLLLRCRIGQSAG